MGNESATLSGQYKDLRAGGERSMIETAFLFRLTFPLVTYVHASSYPCSRRRYKPRLPSMYIWRMHPSGRSLSFTLGSPICANERAGSRVVSLPCRSIGALFCMIVKALGTLAS